MQSVSRERVLSISLKRFVKSMQQVTFSSKKKEKVLIYLRLKAISLGDTFFFVKSSCEYKSFIQVFY